MRTFIAVLVIAFAMNACDSDSGSASKVELSAQQQQTVTENSTNTVEAATERAFAEGGLQLIEVEIDEQAYRRQM